MQKNNKLTIILTIAGRETYTQRWLKYMNDIRCPYKILIGDNKNDPFFDDSKNLTQSYPHLDAAYIRYNTDVSLSSYFAKLVSLVGMVDTDYLLFADNDDFNLLGHFEKYIDFLDANPDFVSARGSAAKFFICSRFGSKPLSLVEGDNYIAFNVINRSIEERNAKQRVDWFLENTEIADVFFNWYSISRTKKVREILNILNLEKEIDPFLHELLFLILMINTGKIKVFGDLALLRQEGSSQNLSSLIAHNPHAFRRIFIENKWQALYSILDKTFVNQNDNIIIRTCISKQLERQIIRCNIKSGFVRKIVDKVKVDCPFVYGVLYKVNIFIDFLFRKKKYLRLSILDDYVLSSKK